MRRFASIWLPAWPLDRLRRVSPQALPDDRPFALVLTTLDGERRQTLHAVNEPAVRGGLAAGLALADARAVLPGLATRPAELAADRAALRRLALWAGRYGPRRHVDGDDGLWIDVSGVAHLFGGEKQLAEDCVGRLATAGITARLGLADTHGAAHALARHATSPRRPVALAPAGGQAAALASLPVEALRLDAPAIRLLHRLGLRAIGQLYDLPRAALERRFRDGTWTGAQAASATAARLVARLDAALGVSAEPKRPLAEPPEHRVQVLFTEPLLTAEGVEAAATTALDRLAGLLDAAGLGARRVRLLLFRADGSVATVAAGTSAPSHDGAHFLGLVRERLAGIDAGFGIDAVVAEAVRVEAVHPVTGTLADRLVETRSGDASRLFDVLAARLGPGRVGRLVPVESHWPERAERLVPLLDGSGETGGGSWPAAGARASRPFLVFPAPEPIAVVAEVPDGPPARFTWRRLSHRVVKSEGPERIEPEWWRAIAPQPAPGRAERARDYYRVEDERGGRFWLFREGLYERPAEGEPAPTWYLHGLYG